MVNGEGNLPCLKSLPQVIFFEPRKMRWTLLQIIFTPLRKSPKSLMKSLTSHYTVNMVIFLKSVDFSEAGSTGACRGAWVATCGGGVRSSRRDACIGTRCVSGNSMHFSALGSASIGSGLTLKPVSKPLLESSGNVLTFQTALLECLNLSDVLISK